MNKLKVAIIGQGRSGRDIHGAYLRSEANTQYEVAAVVEWDPERRERALKEYPGCKVYTEYTELFDVEGLDLVVNATYSEEHYPVTKDLLQHKFNVLVEKPMARNYYECCDLIKTAKDNGVTLAVFQQSFLAPFYLDAKRVIESGKLGDVVQVDLTYSGFNRRWDWQTLQCKMAGSVYNTGPHPIGLALDFLDFSDDMRVAYSRLDRVRVSGDAEDYAKIILTAPGKPVVDVEISALDAYPDYTLKIQGTKGTYKSSAGGAYKMKYIPDGENPDQPLVIESLKNAEGLPAYCSEKLITCEEEGEITGELFGSASHAFYTMLYSTLTTGAPLKVTPEMAAKVINVIETVHAQNPMPVMF